MSGKLFLVATPIGNMEDMTLRAIRILSEVDVIFAEDTRHTSHLLNHHKIHKPLKSCHSFNEARRGGEITSRILAGEKVALVSDAGSPGISDPGFRIVRDCLKQGLAVEGIPGPCAAIAALAISGLPTDEFYFVGFLPSKPGACERKLRELSAIKSTLVFYESPYRVIRTLGQIASVFPEQKVVIGREITKKFEEFLRGPASEILAHFQKHPPKGEFVVLIGNSPEKGNHLHEKIADGGEA